MGVGLGVELAPGEAGLCPGDTPLGIDLELFQAGQINDQSVVDGAVPGHTVPAAAHRKRQVIGTGKCDGLDHVVRVAGANDQRWMAVNSRVPDLSRLVVRCVAGPDHLSVDLLFQRAYGLFRQCDGDRAQGRCHCVLLGCVAGADSESVPCRQRRCHTECRCDPRHGCHFSTLGKHLSSG